MANYFSSFNVADYFPQLESIERDEEKRLAHLPIKYPHLFKFYKKLEASFWTDNDINKDIERDAFDFERATPPEQRLFERVQGSFAISDFVVGDVVGEKIGHRIKSPDARIIYSFIAAQENIHMITYSKIIDKAIPNKKKKEEVLTMASKIPTIKKKVEWIRKWVGMDNDVHDLDRNTIEAIFELVKKNNVVLQALHPNENIDKYKSDSMLRLEEKLKEKIPPLDMLIVALAVTEAVFFSGSFAVVFWFAKNGMFPGASAANQLIQIDEGNHVENGSIIHKTLIKNKVPQRIVHEMVRDAVEVESAFMYDAMPEDGEGIRGMNAKLMMRYVKYSADWVLSLFGYEKLYNIPFDDTFGYMKRQSITHTFTDFFIGEELNYKLNGENETGTDKKPVFDDDIPDI